MLLLLLLSLLLLLPLVVVVVVVVLYGKVGCAAVGCILALELVLDWPVVPACDRYPAEARLEPESGEVYGVPYSMEGLDLAIDKGFCSVTSIRYVVWPQFFCLQRQG